MSDASDDAVIGQVDVVFVVDTTGSMGPFIAEARARMRTIAQEIAQRGQLSLRFAVVEYRDHPPQDRSFAARLHDFTDAVGLQAVFDSLEPAGGGDGPETVLDGLSMAAGAAWREKSDRLCFLVGDAPPHGMGGAGDAWPGGCPCGKTLESVAVELLNARITLTAVALTSEPVLVDSFRALARRTEGEFVGMTLEHDVRSRRRGSAASEAVEVSRVVLEKSSAMVGLARSYRNTMMGMEDASPKKVATLMGITEEEAEKTEGYLVKRGIIKKPGGEDS